MDLSETVRTFTLKTRARCSVFVSYLQMSRSYNEDFFTRFQKAFLNSDSNKRKDALQKEMYQEWSAMKSGKIIDRNAAESRIAQLKAITDGRKAKSALLF